ncbi:tRNA pseudouridine synthase-like 1 [Octopus bimaculoides]|uniref:tRNA pseudouridine synthase n=1 Tax=Octopus bimaculoides TaxID=37653 RepID=A0A0L8FKI5_OCTBM|nr:tRNA pseudouridine synthase-like 1 [Octopus bimaculoides]XP_014789182.1 tRNA pseudouridine synthase-like 1 [Octopus bimaculoides]XP_052826722.1 tRNA pseudouridine synthase-like 1 [Octopus bimaculoides]XP_052826723.1 tRNA pseudouridine synthase-like 1 [Octopus bimaculoides]|eukprot:XP_014789181.1 PREDICTED: tRNA pseudouridine synthase-like 1 [Octopus bimaculoides]
MGRFLIFVSYIGTNYSGIQKQLLNQGLKVLTIQEQLEVSLKSLNPRNVVKTSVSSRTDAGVHAFQNTMHCDLLRKNEDCEYEPEFLKNGMNYWLRKKKETIRVTNVLRVNDDFHSRRQIKNRTYMYRLAIPFKEIAPQTGHSALTLLEKNHAHIIWTPIDMRKLMSAAEAMVGTHDFTAFSTIKSIREKNESPIRTVSINVKLGRTALKQHNPGLEFWEVYIQSRSFLFRQIRRMVGAMVQVALDELTVADIQQKLLRPSLKATDTKIKSLPACGLYLSNIYYDPKDLIYTPTAKSEPDDLNPTDKDADDLNSTDDDEEDLDASSEKI